jgi:hypothetical protein
MLNARLPQKTTKRIGRCNTDMVPAAEYKTVQRKMKRKANSEKKEKRMDERGVRKHRIAKATT